MILSQFDSSGWASIGSEIAQAHLCLRGICMLWTHDAIVPSAFVNLWKNAWPRVKFLDEYEEHMNNDPVQISGRMRYATFVHVVVGRAWCHLIDTENEEGLADVAHFLGDWFRNDDNDDWNSAAIDKLIIGTGRTRGDLASIIVSHFTRILPNPDSPVTRQTLAHLARNLFLVAINYEDSAF
ncbi:hypothetical protein C8R45DRAFT_1148388 [Mycena sanguinolenta]|nr:hypothetical protein C8R45DRAFT_1148388 [Mycena sanguinolenta]